MGGSYAVLATGATHRVQIDGTNLELEVVDRTTVRTLWAVKRNGAILGLLEKIKNSRHETHPYKLMLDYGENVKFLGSFYDINIAKRRIKSGKEIALSTLIKVSTQREREKTAQISQ